MKKEECFIILTCIFGMATAQTNNNECKTPDDKAGVCIDIYLCKSLVTLLQQSSYSASNIAFLQKSFCGFEGKTTKVCCLLKTDIPTATTYAIEKKVEKDVGQNSFVLQSQNTCGKNRVLLNRNIGEKPAVQGAYPWMAALGYQSSTQKGPIQWKCGGTLISIRHVLTSVNCVNNINSDLKLTTVKLGQWDLRNSDDDAITDVPVERIIKHASHNKFYMTNDIALVKLKHNVVYNDRIKPICLPPLTLTMETIDSSNIMPYVAGWSIAEAPKTESTRLNTALMVFQVPLMTPAECKKSYSTERVLIDHRVLCTKYPEGGIETCQGAMGGPLMFPIRDQHFLIGIVSYGYTIDCGEPVSPGVFTRITSFVDWIVQNVNEN